MQEEGITPDAITFDALIDVTEEMGGTATAWWSRRRNRATCDARMSSVCSTCTASRRRDGGRASLRLRRMRSRVGALDARRRGQGTRAIWIKRRCRRVNRAHAVQIAISIRIQVVTGWKHSTVFGHSPVKERVVALWGTQLPFDVPDHNIGCVGGARGSARVVSQDELLSLVRFLGEQGGAAEEFQPQSAGLKANDPTEQ